MTLVDAMVVLDDLRTGDAIPVGVVGDPAISDIVYDSRRVTPGSLFVALKGQKADGSAFAAQAASRGAHIVVADVPRPMGLTIPWVEVSDARLALARLASGESLDDIVAGYAGRVSREALLEASEIMAREFLEHLPKLQAA